MDMNSDARAIMNRWRTSVKSKERRIFRFDERVNLQLNALQARMVTQQMPLTEWLIRQVRYVDIGHYEDIDPEWRTIRVGETWGGKGVSAFFRRDIQIPRTMDGKPLTLRFYVGGDSLLSLNGVPYHGLDPFRNAVRLPQSLNGGDTFTVDVESYVHWHSGEGDFNVFHLAELVVIDPDIEATYWDFVAAFKVLAINNIDNRLQAFLEKHLWDTLRAIPTHELDFEVFKAACLRARDTLRETVYQTDRFKSDGLMHLVGHSHLDIVFMWPHAEYIRKVGRTHATMLRLMEQYPDFKFSQSSAKIYADMKTYFPEIFEQVKQRIAEGRWQAIGAFWVEPDCNLISGESFVRQIMYGQRFWREEFGIDSKTCWQPDVFGMTWSMPQILKRSGIEYLMSNKFFVWNDTNRWRQNTFWWQGADGSQVLTVIPPGHFIGMVDPDHMDAHWRDFSDKETIGESMYCYGWGDGGGGVDPEMLECAVRYQDFPGLVPLQFSHPEDALASIAQKAQSADIPVWRDELYLEAHRGTYTNKARLKKLNRQSEQLYRLAEMLAAFAWLMGTAYPKDSLDSGWRQLLTTQFHDSLPGTHISEVYPYLLNEYAALQGIGQHVCEASAAALFGDEGEQLTVFNSLLNARAGVIALPAKLLHGQTLTAPDGTALAHQATAPLEGEPMTLVYLDGSCALPPVGQRTFGLTAPTHSAESRVHVGESWLENEYLRAEFSPTGELTRLWDKVAVRDVLLHGEMGNQFRLYEDKPGKYDAWDIVASYVEREIPISSAATLTIDETGPLRASLRLTRHIGESRLVQRISLTAASRGLTFETQIDWYERQRLLKVGFPIAINAERATYDIAYGNIERPTHRNTPFDAARFEVPAHWWMDVSEHGYGVALLNDCKYGHEAHGHWMRLTLLKGSIYPDPNADREMHHFTYVLYPHMEGWREGGVIESAAALNTPLFIARTAQPPQAHSFITCDAANVTLEALKKAEESDALIVRLVERHNRTTRATLRFAHAIKSAWVCDLMEREEQEIALHDSHTLTVTLKPYEIVTLKLEGVNPA